MLKTQQNKKQKNEKKVALVVGATGTAGYGVVDYLLGKDFWQVLALSRTIKEGHKKNLVTIKGDLLEPRLLESQLKGYEVTHLFYLAMERDHASKSLKLFFGVRFIKFWLRVARLFLPSINFLLIPPLRGFYFALDPSYENKQFFHMSNPLEFGITLKYNLKSSQK